MENLQLKDENLSLRNDLDLLQSAFETQLVTIGRLGDELNDINTLNEKLKDSVCKDCEARLKRENSQP